MINKMTRAARTIDTLLKIARGIFLGGAIACLVLLIIAVFLPVSQYDKLLDTADSTLSIGQLEIELQQPLPLSDHIKPVAATFLGSVAVALLIGAYGFTVARKIVAPMKEGKPFSGEVSGHLQNLGWIVLGGGAVLAVLEQGLLHLETKMYDLATLFSPETVSGISVGTSLNFSFVLGALLLFLLSYVFRYGEELQKQADETL